MISRVHFVGIAGTGLSAMARVLLERGTPVSGSDLHPNALTDALAGQGALIFAGHAAENVHGAGVVVISSAVPADNPEVAEAGRLGLPVLKRADFLGRLLEGQRTIAIAGTHGKTTTTSMTALLLQRAGRDPSYIIGSVVPELRGNAHAGHGADFVIEADEYDGMFLGLTPWIAVVNNVELDHVDCYPTLDAARLAFMRFAQRTRPDGLILVCRDNADALAAVGPAQQAGRCVAAYGLSEGAGWRAGDLQRNAQGGISFRVWRDAELLGKFDTAIPGRHNVSNALAALAVGFEVGLEPAGMAEALSEFRGAARRFEIKGQAAGVTVVDDYAHHPTEIRATLHAARGRFPHARLWAVWQPHTYSRTQALFEEFVHCFEDADALIITDIYAARERNDGLVHSADLAGRIARPAAQYIGALDDATAYLAEQVRAGDVVLTLGAGDGNRVGDDLLAYLRWHEGHHEQ